VGKASRTKGARLEREVAQILRPFFPGVERNPRQSAYPDGRDLLHTEPLCVQVKGGKAPRWKAALSEATGAAEDSEIPVAVTREDRGDWVAHLGLEDLLKLYRWGER
jgi:hypothetical protein